MFVLYAFLVSLIFCGLDLIFVKTFQLENYNIKKALKFDFAFGNKTPLVFTFRIKRLIFCDFLLKFFIFLLFFGLISNFWVNFAITCVLIVASPFFAVLTFLLTLPLEDFIKRQYIKKAKEKLSKMPCKTIAITGSFGKTSTKNILYQLLCVEFQTTATPKSYNTPMGVCKTILENLKETDDFFIVEFGARCQGDIDTLAKLVGVDFGIITPIGKCHLETFGSLQVIENTKFELCENAKDLVVFNGKSKSSKKLYERFNHKKFLVCTDGSFAFAKNIEVSSTGSKFVMILDGNEIFCQTKLLGKANIDNIVVASAMAYLLGESIHGIVKGISALSPTPHRLELIKGQFVDVIDDSYNSNFDGFKQALEVLNSFSGKKVVVSPGIVELGKAQYEINKQAGEEVGKVADVFIIMNQTNKKALEEGARGKCEIHFANTRQEQKQLLQKILNKGDAVLFENDLPDNMK